MIQREPLVRLHQTALELLASLEVEREALFQASTIGGDARTLDGADRVYLEQMDRQIDRAKSAIQEAAEVLYV